MKQTILVKLAAEKERVEDFTKFLAQNCEIVSKSKLIHNKDSVGCHIFLNILYGEAQCARAKNLKWSPSKSSDQKRQSKECWK